MSCDNAELAAYFGVSPKILSFVPELLQDLWELGSDPDLIVRMLGDAGLRGADKRVLDLGCGKGAVALALAGKLGCRVDGVDAMPEFVEIANRQAESRGLDQLCSFQHGDLRETTRHARGYDAVLLISVGVPGPVETTIAGCRRCVAPGGIIIIDDAYLRDPGRIDFPGYQELTTREETLRQLTAHGDQLVRERIYSLREVHAQNQRYSRWIEARARELSSRYPEHAEAFQAYVEKERQECRILETVVTCAIWMLRRTGS